MMNEKLETKVLKLVNQMLKEDAKAEFALGTLFIQNASTKEFLEVLTELKMLGTYGPVLGSVIAQDAYFAIDFVA